MAAAGQQNVDLFNTYFLRADLDRDGRISGQEAVAFLQGSNLPKHVLAQIWMHADQNRTGFLGRAEFYNALRLVTVAQSGRELSPDMVKAALYGPAAAKIPAPQINSVPASASVVNSVPNPSPQLHSVVPPSAQMGFAAPTASHNLGLRAPQTFPNAGMNQQFVPPSGSQFMRPSQGAPPAASLPIQGFSQGQYGLGSVGGPRFPNSNPPFSSTNWHGGSTIGVSAGVTSQLAIRGSTPSASQDGFGPAPPGVTPEVIPKLQTSSASPSAFPRPLDVTSSSSQSAANGSKGLAVSGNGFSSDTLFGGDIFSATPQAKQDAMTTTSSMSSMPSTSLTASGSQASSKPGQPEPLHSTSSLLSGSGLLHQTQSSIKQNQMSTMQGASGLSTSNILVGSVSSSSDSQLLWPKITQSDIQKYTAVFVEVDKDRDGKITGEQARNLFLSWRLPREVLKQVWDLSDQDNDSMLSLREFCTALYLMERFREGRSLPAVLPNSVKFDETLLRATGQPSTAYGGTAWQPTPGLLQQGVPGSRPVVPVSGMRPPLPNSFPSQTGLTGQQVQQRSRAPMENLLSMEKQIAQNSKLQEPKDTDGKVVLEKQILDSKEKIEFYRTKMQDLVLYKSRCDNKLNEITERASADKKEAESLGKKYEEKYKQVGDVASKLAVEETRFRDIQERKLELHNAIIRMEQGGSADGLLQVRVDRIQSDLEELEKALNGRCKRHGIHIKPTTSVELPFGWQPGILEGAADWDEDWDKFEDEGFMLANELSDEVENGVTSTKHKSPSSWSDKASVAEVSPITSSSVFDSNSEKHFGTGERKMESGSAYAPSEGGSARSPPSSPGKFAFDSPSGEHSSHFTTHDISPRAKESLSDNGGTESSIFGDKFGDEASWGVSFDANDDTDSVWGFNPIKTRNTDHERSGHDSLFNSGDFGLNPIRVDSPSAGSVFGKEKSSFFADSVPSTPLFNSGSPRRFSAGAEDQTFDSFSKFDSFRAPDSGFFPQHESLTRFDSIRSTRDSDHSHGLQSFDDADPFGSTGPFKVSESHSPRRNSDNWPAF